MSDENESQKTFKKTCNQIKKDLIDSSKSEMKAETKEITIDSLNDYCLDYIFEYLKFDEKEIMELVCKRWNLVAKRYWKRIIALSTNDEKLFPKPKSFDDFNSTKELKNYDVDLTEFFKTLKKCSPFLKKFYIDVFPLREKYYILSSVNLNKMMYKIKESARKYCKNLTHMHVVNEDLFDHTFNNEDMKFLFENNKNLESIFLQSVICDKSCLLKLNADNITEFFITGHCFEPRHLSDVLPKFKNLKKFGFCYKRDRLINILDILTANKFENLIEITFGETLLTLEDKRYEHQKKDTEFFDKLELFLSMRKQLKKLKLQHLLINKKLVKTFAASLEDLELEFCRINRESFKFIFQHCENLKIFSCKPRFMENFLFDEIPENCLFNLESFTISNNDPYKYKLSLTDNCVDLMIKSLSKCSNLQKLVIKKFYVTAKGLKNIECLTNLIHLELPLGNLFRPNDLDDLLKKLVNLKTLKISYLGSEDYQKIIDLLQEIKINRGSKIIFEEAGIENRFYKEGMINSFRRPGCNVSFSASVRFDVPPRVT